MPAGDAEAEKWSVVGLYWATLCYIKPSNRLIFVLFQSYLHTLPPCFFFGGFLHIFVVPRRFRARCPPWRSPPVLPAHTGAQVTAERGWGANLANSHSLPAARLCSGHGDISLLNTTVTSSSSQLCAQELSEGEESDGRGRERSGGVGMVWMALEVQIHL